MNKELHSYTEDAQTIMQDTSKLLALLTQAFAKADACHEALKTAWNRLMVLIRLVKAWISGNYQEIPWYSIATAVAAILYFVNPVDLIPDVIPVIGYLDDAAIIGLAIAAMGEDFNAFIAWESSQAPCLADSHDNMNHTAAQGAKTTGTSIPEGDRHFPFSLN